MKKLCLNMIVKNEEKILERCLRSAAPYISAYAILDTGSTDGTCDLIKKIMEELSIPGVIGKGEFKDFSQARNLALDLCKNSDLEFTHILLMDADMELIVTDPESLQQLGEQNGLILQKHEYLEYWNVRIIPRSGDHRYMCPTHEYITQPNGVTNLKGLYFWDHACGSNRSEKYQRDLRLLAQAILDDPKQSRNYFYLAQTYRELGEKEKAIEYYLKRAEMGGWVEEVSVAFNEAGNLMEELGFTEAEIVQTHLKAHYSDTRKAEPLMSLSYYYGKFGKPELSFAYAYEASKKNKNDTILFVKESSYNYSALVQIGVQGFYADSFQKGKQACEKALLLAPDEDASFLKNNLTFYLR